MQHFVPHIFSETEADPQTKIFGHHWGGRPHPVAGLNPANPLQQIEHCKGVEGEENGEVSPSSAD